MPKCRDFFIQMSQEQKIKKQPHREAIFICELISGLTSGAGRSENVSIKSNKKTAELQRGTTDAPQIAGASVRRLENY